MSQPLVPYTQYPALSFVLLRGFGDSLIPVQMSIDSKFIILSTHYNLTPVYAVPPLIGGFVGTYAEIIDINKSAFTQLLQFIDSKALANSDRIKNNDPLIVIRAFCALNKSLNLADNQEIILTQSDLESAINTAISQDDLIKNIHFNMVSALAKIQNAPVV